MEKMILISIITLALLYIITRVKKRITGLVQDDFQLDCSSCGSCRNNNCKSKIQIDREERKG